MKPTDLDDLAPPEPDREVLARVRARSISFRHRRSTRQWTGAVSVFLVLVLAGGIAWARVGSNNRHVLGPETSSTTVPTSRPITVTRGERLGWHTMAYLGSNRASVPIELTTSAPAGVTVGTATTVEVSTFPVGSPVWSSINPTRLTVQARTGRGRLEISTTGCPARGACDHRPLYTDNATPIPPAPAGGIVTKLGFALKIDSSAIAPGRYDLALPIRYPSNDKFPTVLDTSDTLHVRIDVTATPPPSSICTLADLHAPTAAVPPAHVLADTVVVENGNTRLDPPPPGFQPRVSPARVRERFASMRGSLGGGGEAALVLASVSEIFSRSVHSDGTSTPDTHNVVAWVLYTQRVAGIPPAPPPGATYGEVTTRPQPTCAFFDGMTAVNATTGAQMDSAGFTSAAVPFPL